MLLFSVLYSHGSCGSDPQYNALADMGLQVEIAHGGSFGKRCAVPPPANLLGPNRETPVPAR